MVNVDIDKSLYENITKIVNENKLDFPSIRHFVNKMLFEKVKENNFKKWNMKQSIWLESYTA